MKKQASRAAGKTSSPSSKKSAKASATKSSKPAASKRTASASTKRSPATAKKTSKASNTTTDHDEIRQWAESRGGVPACVKTTGGKGDAGILRIDFPGVGAEGSLQAIEWEEWFEKFDNSGLEFLYQDKTAAGKTSRFNKQVSRETAEGQGRAKSAGRSGTKSAASRG